MASNGESKKGEEKASDTVMVGAAPSDSPFALLHQPKVELFDAISAPATNASKPRFEPKVKPRGGAQANARAAAASKPAPPPPQAEPVPSPNPNPNPPPNSVTVEQLKKPKGESAAQLAAALNGDNVNIKLEPSVPSVNIKTEAAPQAKVESDSVIPDVGMREADSSPGLEKTSSRQEGGDHVVREIDVFLSKSVDPDTQFYLQYPLRPAWRPYALEEMCQEVRLKAKQKRVEVDLAIDTDSENYDQEAAEHLQIKTQDGSFLVEDDDMGGDGEDATWIDADGKFAKQMQAAGVTSQHRIVTTEVQLLQYLVEQTAWPCVYWQHGGRGGVVV